MGTILILSHIKLNANCLLKVLKKIAHSAKYLPLKKYVYAPALLDK